MITNVTSGYTYTESKIGIRQWESTTIFNANDFCTYGGKIYRSLLNDNRGQNPSIPASVYWEVYVSTRELDYNCVMNFSLDSNSTYICSYGGTLTGATPVVTTGQNTSIGSFNNHFAWMNEIYVCTLDEDGTERHRLNPNNLNEDIYGADMSQEIQQYDVMVHMPDCAVALSDNSIAINSDVSYGGHRLAHTYGNSERHDLYIAMYPISMESMTDKAHSLSGKTATTGTGYTRSVFREGARKKNVSTDGWHLWNYHEYNLYRALVLQVIKSFDSQGKIGRGLDTGGQAVIATNGALNDKGWFAGDVTSGNNPVKCIIENPWANRWQFVDDMVVDSGPNSNILIGTEYYVNIYAGHNAQTYASSGASAISDILTDKEVIATMPIGTTNTVSGNSGYVQINTSPKGWGIPNARSGSTSTGTCDWHWWSGADKRVPLVGGNSGRGLYCGLFALAVADALSTSYWTYGARLAYIR